METLYLLKLIFKINLYLKYALQKIFLSKITDKIAVTWNFDSK